MPRPCPSLSSHGAQMCCKAEPAGALSWAAASLSTHRPRALTWQHGPRRSPKSQKTDPRYWAFQAAECGACTLLLLLRSACTRKSGTSTAAGRAVCPSSPHGNPPLPSAGTALRGPGWTPDSGATPPAGPSREERLVMPPARKERGGRH